LPPQSLLIRRTSPTTATRSPVCPAAVPDPFVSVMVIVTNRLLSSISHRRIPGFDRALPTANKGASEISRNTRVTHERTFESRAKSPASDRHSMRPPSLVAINAASDISEASAELMPENVSSALSLISRLWSNFCIRRTFISRAIRVLFAFSNTRERQSEGVVERSSCERTSSMRRESSTTTAPINFVKARGGSGRVLGIVSIHFQIMTCAKSVQTRTHARVQPCPLPPPPHTLKHCSHLALDEQGNNGRILRPIVL
jgi:hypothetical protein